jgi:hypothetical protein
VYVGRLAAACVMSLFAGVYPCCCAWFFRGLAVVFICDDRWLLIYPCCLLAGRFVGYVVIIYVILLLLCKWMVLLLILLWFIGVNFIIGTTSTEVLLLTYFCGVVMCGCCRVAAMWRVCLLA